MKLHEDNDVFIELIGITAETIGIPQVYVEKDYWVTKALKYLSESSYIEDVVFKGGTSLSKAYKLINRFSEDIDLAVFPSDKSDGARKKLIKDIEGTVTQGLDYLKFDERESKGSRFRKTVHQYPRKVDGVDFGQASPELLIEINSFTTPEPFESRKLQTFIAEVLDKKSEHDLIAQYDLEHFSINVLSVRRTLTEKILGVIKDSYHEHPASRLSDRIRHLYDICLILKHDEYRDFVASNDFKPLYELCIKDEQTGFFRDSSYLERELIEAPLFSKFTDWRSSLNTTYTGVFSDLVYDDLPPIEDIEETLNFIKKNLQ